MKLSRTPEASTQSPLQREINKYKNGTFRQVCEFGVRYQIFEGAIHVYVPGWSFIKTCSEIYLKSVYEDSISFLKDDDSFSINIHKLVGKLGHEGHFLLSQLRTQALGAPILQSLERLGKPCITSHEEESVFSMKTYPQSGSCHCMNRNEKVMVFLVPNYKNGTERALARLILQQFELAQKQVRQSPHCEFREKTTVELERMRVNGHLPKGAGSAGFLCFTFFPLHAQTADARWKATKLIVDFFPYLDSQIKSMKSHMNSRMRMKKDELLTELTTEAGKAEKTAVSMKFRGYHQACRLSCPSERPRTR